MTSGSGCPAARCGCTCARRRRSAALRRCCASTASRRRRPCRPGRPRSSAACASGWAWRSRWRRWTCPRAACGSRCRWPASSALSLEGLQLRPRCALRRHRTARRSRRSAASATRSRDCRRDRRSRRRAMRTVSFGLARPRTAARRPARPCSSGSADGSWVSCRVPHPEAVILAHRSRKTAARGRTPPFLSILQPVQEQPCELDPARHYNRLQHVPGREHANRPYEIVASIGSGGMGEVFESETHGSTGWWRSRF